MLATGLINYLNKLLDHPNMAHHMAAIARDIIRELLIPGEVTSQVFWILCTRGFHLSIADLQMTCIYLKIGNNDKPPKMATIATHPVLICFPQHAQLADATFHNLKSTNITHNFRSLCNNSSQSAQSIIANILEEVATLLHHLFAHSCQMVVEYLITSDVTYGLIMPLSWMCAQQSHSTLLCWWNIYSCPNHNGGTMKESHVVRLLFIHVITSTTV